jgi:uncharacterized protein YndB with AHSA1/START domain
MSIVVQAEVSRPVEEVFDYVTDPARFSEWQANVTGGHMSSGPAQVGSLCTTTRRIGGAEREVTSRLVTLDPPRAWGVRGVDGPIRSIVNVTVEPLDSGNRSRVTIDLDFSGHGIGKILVPLVVRPQSRKEMRANIARLKDRLENHT